MVVGITRCVGGEFRERVWTHEITTEEDVGLIEIMWNTTPMAVLEVGLGGFCDEALVDLSEVDIKCVAIDSDEEELGGVVPEDALGEDGGEAVDDVLELGWSEEAQGYKLSEIAVCVQPLACSFVEVGGVEESDAWAGDFAEFERDDVIGC